jgi:hypothetical protein
MMPGNKMISRDSLAPCGKRSSVIIVSYHHDFIDVQISTHKGEAASLRLSMTDWLDLFRQDYADNTASPSAT